MGLTCHWYRCACSEGIASVAVRTVAHGHVVVHPALGAEAAHARARVDALVALTGLGAVTVGVDRTLGPTALLRIAEVLGQAAAHTETVVLAALGIYTALAREACGLLFRNRCRSCCNWREKHKPEYFVLSYLVP